MNFLVVITTAASTSTDGASAVGVREAGAEPEHGEGPMEEVEGPLGLLGGGSGREPPLAAGGEWGGVQLGLVRDSSVNLWEKGRQLAKRQHRALQWMRAFDASAPE